MVLANRGQSKDVKTLVQQHASLEKQIPYKITEGRAGGYVLLLVWINADANGVVTARLKVVAKDINSWEAMGSATTNVAFNCNRLIILHTPEEETEDEEFVPYETKGRMTDTKADSLSKMDLSGHSDEELNEVAEQINISFSVLKDYIAEKA